MEWNAYQGDSATAKASSSAIRKNPVGAETRFDCMTTLSTFCLGYFYKWINIYRTFYIKKFIDHIIAGQFKRGLINWEFHQQHPHEKLNDIHRMLIGL